MEISPPVARFSRLDAATARLTAPLIRGVQDAAAFAAPGDAITVHPASGIILVLQ